MLPFALLALAAAALPGAALPNAGLPSANLPNASLPSSGQPIGDAANWLHSGDFPSTEWHMAAVTRYDLMVDEVGQTVGCTITGPSGSAIVDQVACTSLIARARYSPARDGRGRIVPQAIRGRLEWHPDSDSGNELRNTADLAVQSPSVSRKQGIVAVKVVVIYAPSGAIEQCVVVKRAPVARINQQACAEASAPGTFTPVRDARGATIRGLREIEVVFSHGEKRQVTIL